MSSFKMKKAPSKTKPQRKFTLNSADIYIGEVYQPWGKQTKGWNGGGIGVQEVIDFLSGLTERKNATASIDFESSSLTVLWENPEPENEYAQRVKAWKEKKKKYDDWQKEFAKEIADVQKKEQDKKKAAGLARIKKLEAQLEKEMEKLKGE